MSEVFTECILVDKVNLRPSDLYDDPKATVAHLLRDRYEGKCSRHGYIRTGSVKIHKLGLGQVQMVSLNGDVSYTVQFSAGVCLPVVGNVFKATVKNMNKFGVLCDVTRDRDTVMEIIVAKNSPEIQSEVNLDDLRIGDAVNVEVLGRKFELNDKKISIIGRLVVNFKQSRVVQRAQSLAVAGTDASNADDVESIVPTDEDDDEEDEEDDESSGEEEEKEGDSSSDEEDVEKDEASDSAASESDSDSSASEADDD